MTTNTTLFSYQELKGPCAFRLLELLPGQRVDPICFTIQHASVASRPEFYALSYCWGAASDREHVWIDGKLLPIQRNLHEFLNELRLLDRPRTIWADAICINQGDIAERTTQIALMRDIYSAAQTVMVWLGPHDAGSPQLFESFELIAADRASVQTSGSRDWKDDIGPAFEELMSRSYWRRTWIIQEIVLANNIRLFCGNASTLWLDFVAMYKTLFQEASPASQPRSPLLKIRPKRLSTRATKKSRRKHYCMEALDMLVDLRKRDAQPLLLDMMDWNHPFECFDFRDRVYGMLGFVADGADFLPLVDYHCSAEDLFLSVLKKLKVHTDRSFYNFITRLQTLATRIGLDLAECTEVLTVLQGTESDVLTSFDANADFHLHGREVYPIMYAPNESASEVQLKRTSLTLRKYYHFSQRYEGFQGDLITRAELTLGDWLIFLHPGVAPNCTRNPPLHRGQGLYGIYRDAPRDKRYRLIDYCVLVNSKLCDVRLRHERAAYEFFDNEVRNLQDMSSMQRSFDRIEGGEPCIYLPMSEILRIGTFKRYIHSAASTQVSPIDWREVKTRDYSPRFQVISESSLD